MASTLPAPNACCSDGCDGQSITVLSAAALLSGHGSPEGSIIGQAANQLYSDIDNGDWYYFGGVVGTSTGWTLIPMIISASENHIGKVGGETTTVLASMVRPANVTPYTTGDAINTGAVATVPLTFVNTARIAAGTGTILHAWILDEANQAALMSSPELWLFDTGFTANSDNDPWAPSNGDLQHLIGVIPFATSFVANPAAGALGSVMFDSAEINRPFKCVSGRDLYGIIVVRSAYTPVSQEVFSVRLEVMQD